MFGTIRLFIIYPIVSLSMSGSISEIIRETMKSMYSVSKQVNGKLVYCSALIVGIIQKWMRTHKDLSKIDAKVHQVSKVDGRCKSSVMCVAGC